MNVFQFAMQMEKDGEAFYRELAAKSNNTGLQKIFTMLAEEEVVHYNTFKRLFEKSPAEAVESNALSKAKTIFVEMKKSGNFNISADTPQTEAYRKAMEAEKEAYIFYEKKAEEAGDDREKQVLLVFAREERHHYHLLENILEFVSQPESWTESAEFTRLQAY
jgi:rubrerythrin